MISLENNLRLIELEEAKVEDPWQLITKPTLIDAPVSPSSKKISLIGLIIGFSLGSFYTFYKERKSNIIFDEALLKNYFSVNVLEKISIKDIELNSENVSLVKEYINSLPGKKLNIIILGKIGKLNLETLKNYFKDEDRNKSIKVIQALKDIKSSYTNDNHLLIIDKNNLLYSEVTKLVKYLKMFNLKVDSLILI